MYMLAVEVAVVEEAAVVAVAEEVEEALGQVQSFLVLRET